MLRRFTQSRRALTDLHTLAEAQVSLAASLKRIADHLCGPNLPEPDPQILRADTGVSYSRDEEQTKILDYVERTTKDTGRPPTDDEIVRFLDGVEV